MSPTKFYLPHGTTLANQAMENSSRKQRVRVGRLLTCPGILLTMYFCSESCADLRRAPGQPWCARVVCKPHNRDFSTVFLHEQTNLVFREAYFVFQNMFFGRLAITRAQAGFNAMLRRASLSCPFRIDFATGKHLECFQHAE